MDKSNVLIIGYGTVGKNMNKIFTSASICDPFKKCSCVDNKNYSIIKPPCTFGNGECNLSSIEQKFSVGFVCVPTDKLPDGSADTSIVEEIVQKHKDHCDVLCIKSTIPPGTTKLLAWKGYPVIFSPEYFGATAHANAVNNDFVILGGNRKYTNQVAEAYQEIFPANLRILQTDSTTAELVKYGENAWIATKVTFVNEFYRLCKKMGVDYREWRELWLADERISRSHTFVYDDHPFYQSHCLDKDVPAIIREAKDRGIDLKILMAVVERNEEWKSIFPELF
jgi:nucleotide sugar dehydrogenase